MAVEKLPAANRYINIRCRIEELFQVMWDSPDKFPNNNIIKYFFNNNIISEPIVIGANPFNKIA
jgi:hypothetical protein